MSHLSVCLVGHVCFHYRPLLTKRRTSLKECIRWFACLPFLSECGLLPASSFQFSMTFDCITGTMVCRMEEVTKEESGYGISVSVTSLFKTLQWFPIVLAVRSKCFIWPHRASLTGAPSASVASWVPILLFFPTSFYSLDVPTCSHRQPLAVAVLLPTMVSACHHVVWSLLDTQVLVCFFRETFPN